jgi:hypothetical protein
MDSLSRALEPNPFLRLRDNQPLNLSEADALANEIEHLREVKAAAIRVVEGTAPADAKIPPDRLLADGPAVRALVISLAVREKAGERE